MIDNSDTFAGVEVRDWALDDPSGRDIDRVREIRDEITELFDEIEANRDE